MTNTATPQRVITPTVARTLTRGAFWLGAVVLTLLIASIAIALSGGVGQGITLSTTNAAPGGTMALAEVLRQRGVEVVATSSLGATRNEIDSAASTTLFIYDDGFLDEAQLTEAVSLADTVVVALPGFAALRAIAPSVAQAGDVQQSLAADCAVPAVDRAETVSGESSGYRIIDDSAGAVACLGSGDGIYAIVQIDGLTILGAAQSLTNGSIASDGNAALALGLLGSQDTLVWYLPGFEDYTTDVTPTLGELSPEWVTPAVGLLVLTFIAAAIWRGRRFGPLVVENLPVMVKASETMIGRARLYEKSSARLRAVDSLRVGTIQRLADLCGMPRIATVEEVIVAVAAVTHSDLSVVRDLLVNAEPLTDRDLVALSDDLLTLESDVARATRP
jgi:BarA-like signal transduction histidine kinase